MDCIQTWLKDNTCLVTQDNYVQDLINAGVKVYYRALTLSTEHKIKDNALRGYKTAYITDSIENFCKTYLRSRTREETRNNNPVPKKLGPIDIHKICSRFTYINNNQDCTDYMAEILTVYSSPDLFIMDLLDRIKEGEFNYKNISEVPANSSVFKIHNKIYIHVNEVIEQWKTLFNYKLIYSPQEVKRAIWAVSKTTAMYTFHLKHKRYREVQI